jgi:hypothetical protein
MFEEDRNRILAERKRLEEEQWAKFIQVINIVIRSMNSFR